MKNVDDSGRDGCHEKELTVFTSKNCGACRFIVPTILEMSSRAGFSVKLIDVYSEDLRMSGGMFI